AVPPPAPQPPLLAALPAQPQVSAVATTANFRVHAPSQRTADLIAQVAEKERAALARKWLGQELPDWPTPCPVWVRLGDVAEQPRGPCSTFTFEGSKAVKREMPPTGHLDQLLAAQIPHEVMHAVLADHFGRPLPRWADEGIAIMATDETSQ